MKSQLSLLSLVMIQVAACNTPPTQDAGDATQSMDVMMDASADTTVDTGAEISLDASVESGVDANDDRVEASLCASGEMLCGSTCIDVQNDPDHCGSCENACPTAATCRVRLCMNATCAEGPAAARSACPLAGGGMGVCDLQASPTCVACVADGDCSDALRPLCAATTNTCRARSLLLFATTINLPQSVLGGSYALGTWTTRPLGMTGSYATTQLGGGVAALDGARGIGLVRTQGGAPLGECGVG